MRLLSVIIVVCSVAIVLVVWLVRPGPSGPTWPFSSGSSELRVTGPGNTLASLAAAANDPACLTYDPLTRTAIAHASLIIEGELLLGRQGHPEEGENLQLDTQYCGDLHIEVRPGGALRLYHSLITTVSQILTQNACSRGYALFVDGTLTMEDSRISYISGSTSQVLRGNASALLRRSSFSHCDGTALSCIGVDGRRVTIDGCEIRCSGNWGLVVANSQSKPLEVRDSVLDAAAAAVLIADEQGRLRLIDCALDESKIAFSQPGGEIAFAWTRRFHVVDADGKPRAGMTVRATSASEVNSAETVQAQTDQQGLAELVLTEWVARAGAVKRTSNNTLSPYAVNVLGAHGERLAEQRSLAVHGKDANPVMLVMR